MENEIKNELPEAETAEGEALEELLLELKEEEGEEAEHGAPDYRRMAEEDLAEVKRLCPRLAISDLAELPNPARFGELREMGLSVEEALGAVGIRRDACYDNRTHLRSSVPKRLGESGVRMSAHELDEARRLFPALSEREIARLYRRVKA